VGFLKKQATEFFFHLEPQGAFRIPVDDNRIPRSVIEDLALGIVEFTYQGNIASLRSRREAVYGMPSPHSKCPLCAGVSQFEGVLELVHEQGIRSRLYSHAKKDEVEISLFRERESIANLWKVLPKYQVSHGGKEVRSRQPPNRRKPEGCKHTHYRLKSQNN
jgi:hypothetical protein